MAYDDLRSLLRALEREGDLKRIKAEVDPYLEVGEIVDRVQKAQGPALLFETSRVAMPLAMNVFGTDRRLLKALGLKSYATSEKIGAAEARAAARVRRGPRAFGKLGAMAHVPPKKVKDAPVQEVVLGARTWTWTSSGAVHWPQTAGPSSTSG